MKAVLLAAGLGTRLKPLTDTTPKCLIPIHGKPLLEHWLDILSVPEVSEVFVNGFYFAGKVRAFLEDRAPNYKFKIHFIEEHSLTGTGGFLKKIKNKLLDEEYFFFAHADNFCDLNLPEFIDFHRKRKTRLSMALFHTSRPESCGIAEEIEPDGRIVKFLEKSPHAKGNLASAAIFLMSPAVFEDFPEGEVIDFSRDVLPLQQGRMYGYEMPGFNIDIGTPEQYEAVRKMVGVSK
ncbi:MAG: D-glycero-alpha-D-manno-heptose 1-phosphate guanylyltransferase [Lentisphaerae bacterium ADurb.Bin242]|nr:MAG: D-glycero-alpha-D-manno-heptose 1-phosphate guanylyltransferase [Lentisphaerae bacterium ADurb.Bin242]